MRAQRSEHPSWPWILANAAGFAIGGAIAGAMVLAAEDALVGTVGSQQAAAAALVPIVAVWVGVFGAVVGAHQWLVLRRWLPLTGWWIAVTAGGWAAAGAIDGALSGYLSGTVTGVGPGVGVGGFVLSTVAGVTVLGLLPGLLQSFMLRRHIEPPLVCRSPGRGRRGLSHRVPGDVARGWTLRIQRSFGIGLGSGRPPHGDRVRIHDLAGARADRGGAARAPSRVRSPRRRDRLSVVAPRMEGGVP